MSDSVSQACQNYSDKPPEEREIRRPKVEGRKKAEIRRPKGGSSCAGGDSFWVATLTAETRRARPSRNRC